MINHKATNLPPPPTIEDVYKLIPEDFKPGWPPTDRLASLIDAFNISKQLTHQAIEKVDNYQNNYEKVFNDFVITLKLLRKISAEGNNAEVDEWLNKFPKDVFL